MSYVEFGCSPVFLLFIAFSIIFLLIILHKSCVVMSRTEIQRSWAAQPQRTRRPANISTNSTTSVEIHANTHPQASFVSPPGYYSEVMVTDSSAMYPVYVPPYSTTQSSPLMSLRDPRRFQGLPGLQAPPLYPPPPSYSQIQNFPELPTISNARLDNRTSSRNGKKSEITPVE